jgi:hypothetical protein
LTPTQLDSLLRNFRRQLKLVRALRALLFVGTACAVLWAATLPRPDNRQAMFGVFIATLVIWLLSMLNAAQLARSLRTAGALLSLGQLDNAELWLRRVLDRFSLSTRTKILAAQQYASLLFRRDAHQEVVAICGELLRNRIGRLQAVWINTRLMMADSLLMLGRVPDAYDAMRPVYDVPLSLSDRMRLLPIQLRYELAADHADTAAQGLPEKLQIAELLDSPRAALVHALLAEACRRTHKPEQQAYLAEKARLYHDLNQLAERYPVITAIANQPS